MTETPLPTVQEINPKPALEVVVPFLDKNVTISAAVPDLQEKIVGMAVKQNVAEKEAREFVRKVRFSIDKMPHEYGQSQGLVTEKIDHTWECIVDTYHIANCIKAQAKRLPPEAQEAFFIKTIEGVWEHEAQHVVQRMKPGVLKEYENHRKKRKKVWIVTLSTIGGSIAVGNAAIFSQLPDLPGKIIAGTSMGITLVGSFVGAIYNNKLDKTNPLEVDAKSYQLTGHEDIPSPFKFTFENKF